MVVYVFHEVVGSLELLGSLEELVLAHADEATDLSLHQAHVAYGLDDVARARLTLGANHRGTLGNAAERLAEIACATDERHLKLCLVDMVDVVRRAQHLALVDVVDLDGLKNLCLDEVADAALGHHGDGDGGLDALDHLRVAHAAHATSGTDVGGNALASSATLACSGVVTSMITPPFSIWARLRFNSCLFCSMILFSFYCLIFCLGWQRDCFGEGIGRVGQRWKPLTQLVGSEGATDAPTPCSAVESRWVSFPSVS